MEITKYQFSLYEKVRNSNRTNMMDVQEVGRLSGLTREQIIHIIGNYGDLKTKYQPITERAAVTPEDLKPNKLYRGRSGAVRRISAIKAGQVLYDALPRNKELTPKAGKASLEDFAKWVQEII